MRRLFLYRNILWKYSTTQIKKKKRASICTLTEITSKCGDGEIRTRDTVSRIHTFQACSFNHSDTSPLTILLSNELSAFKPHFLPSTRDSFNHSDTSPLIILLSNVLSAFKPHFLPSTRDSFNHSDTSPLIIFIVK